MFEDLEFNKNLTMPAGYKKAQLIFENGYGVSVITGPYTYSNSNNDNEFELAVIDANGDLRYDTPITDDVLGYLSPSEVSNVMQQVKALPNIAP